MFQLFLVLLSIEKHGKNRGMLSYRICNQCIGLYLQVQFHLFAYTLRLQDKLLHKGLIAMEAGFRKPVWCCILAVLHQEHFYPFVFCWKVVHFLALTYTLSRILASGEIDDHHEFLPGIPSLASLGETGWEPIADLETCTSFPSGVNTATFSSSSSVLCRLLPITP